MIDASVRTLAYDVNGEPWDVVRVVERPPERPGPGQVLVALEAAPLHIADLKAIRGDLPFAPKGPGIPGFEGVGRILALGEGVTGWNVGDRVILPLCYGACRERLNVPAQGLWCAPADAPAEQLALVRVNLTTAYMLLHAYADLQPGDWILQNAANSNVAGYVALLAEQLGVNVINLVRRPELVPAIKSAGREHVMLDDPASIGAICAELGIRPRLALDAIGGGATERMAAAVADDGLVLAYGFVSGEPYRIHYDDAMFRNVRLEVMTITQATKIMSGDDLQTMAERLQAFIAAAPLNAQIAGIYPFDQAAEALRMAAQTGAGRSGKVILVP